MLTAIACTLALVQTPGPAVEARPASAAAGSTDTPPAVEGPAAASSIVGAREPEAGESQVVPPPHWRGTGLLISGGVLGGLALAANIARIAVVRNACDDIVYDPTTRLSGSGLCRDGGRAVVVLGGAAFGLNLAALGTLGAGASLRGSWAAHDTNYRTGRRAASGAQIGVGAGLLAAGVVGYVVVRVMSFTDALGAVRCGDRYPVDGMATDQTDSARAGCIRDRWSGYLIGITAAQAVGVGGSGLLAHGASYRRNLKLYRAVSSHQVRLRPSFAPTFAGAALTGRF